ncbi:3-oxo-5-alpha-steroid 4-dehydrogenase [Pycnococcus provasolii]
MSPLTSHPLNLMAGFMLVCGVAACTTMTVFQVKTPYGRYTRPGWGPLVPARLAWILQEAPTPVVAIALLAQRNVSKLDPSSVAHILLVVHYIHRAFIYPLGIRNGKPTPVVVMALAFTFCTYNGSLQGTMLKELEGRVAWSPLTIAGLGVMLFGAYHNVLADYTLRSLRRTSSSAQRYVAPPNVGLFTWVSGANFLGEIVEWSGYAMLCGGALPAVAFAAFTALNIGPRAVHHHADYCKKIDGYDALGRTAIIPFLL